MSACAFALQVAETRKSKSENRNSKIETRNSKLENRNSKSARIRNSLGFSPSANGFGLPISAFRRVPSRKLEIRNSLRISIFDSRFSVSDFRFSNFDFRISLFELLPRALSQGLIEDHGGCHGNIERRHGAAQGDMRQFIARFPHQAVQARSLSPQHQRAALRIVQIKVRLPGLGLKSVNPYVALFHLLQRAYQVGDPRNLYVFERPGR